MLFSLLRHPNVQLISPPHLVDGVRKGMIFLLLVQNTVKTFLLNLCHLFEIWGMSGHRRFQKIKQAAFVKHCVNRKLSTEAVLNYLRSRLPR